MVKFCETAIKSEEKNCRHLPAVIDIYLRLRENFTAVHSPGAGLFSIRKHIFRFVPNGIIPRHHIIDSTEFTGISDFYAFAVNSGDPMGKVWHRFCPCFCESCIVGEFHACENEEFLEPWKERYITVTEDVQASVQEQLEATMDLSLIHI